MKRTIQILLLLSCIISTHLCTAAETEHSGYVPIGQPTIFWRYGEWQTYKDGKWVPYFDSLKQATMVAEPIVVAEPEPEPVPEQPLDIGVPIYGGGYAVWGPSWQGRRFERVRDHLRNQRARDNCVQPGSTAAGASIGIGKTTIGIGQQSGGIGRPTIGIGQPNTAIGRTTIGIGKPTIGIGQPTATIGKPLFSASQAAPVSHQTRAARVSSGTTRSR